MLITVQYTLTDIRKFDQSYQLLKSPQWPRPKPFVEFVRGNGPIIPRNRVITTKLGKINISEDRICKISKGIKIGKKKNIPELNAVIESRFKHYFSDGGVLSKYEFIFRITSEILEFSYNDLKIIINAILESTVFIRNKQYSYSKYSFKNVFAGLRELHIISTTPNKNNCTIPQAAIINCTPQVFITLNNKQSFTSKLEKKVAIPVNDNYNSTLFGWWEKYNNYPYKIWVLQNRGKSKNENLLSLKTGILRIHSEKECINNVILCVLKGYLRIEPQTEQSDRIQEFLNSKIKNLGPTYKSINELDGTSERIERFIKEAYNTFDPGEIMILSVKLKDLNLRPQVTDKLVKHIYNYSTHIEKIMDNSQKITIKDNGQITGDIHQEQNIHNNSSPIDFKSIYEGISVLLERLQLEQNSYEREVAVENLESAKKATVKKDYNGVIEFLKKAGDWTFDFASKVGVSIISEVIKQHMKGS